MNMDQDTRTIDITPSWQGLLPLLVEVAANGDTTEGRKSAMDELMRLAKTVDDMNAAASGKKLVDLARTESDLTAKLYAAYQAATKAEAAARDLYNRLELESPVDRPAYLAATQALEDACGAEEQAKADYDAALAADEEMNMKYYTLNEVGQAAVTAIVLDLCSQHKDIKPSAFFEDAENAMNDIFGSGSNHFEINHLYTDTKRPELVDVQPEWFDAKDAE